MKDGVSFTYSAPVVEVLSLNQDDVICTSPWLSSVTKLLGGTKWKQEWTDILEPEGMEGIN